MLSFQWGFASPKDMYKAMLVGTAVLLALKDPEGIHLEEARKRDCHNVKRPARKKM